MTSPLYDSVNGDVIRDTLDKFKDLKLSEHYDFNAETECLLNDAHEVSNFLKSNKPITFLIGDNNVLYYETEVSEGEKIFEIDVEKSFSKSDEWLYDKLIPVSFIFPNVSEKNTSDEMASLYVCIVIASVFGEEFEKDLVEVASQYDFKKWEPISELNISFLELATDWIQIGSKYIKMVAAAAKYALLREKRKKLAQSALQLPKEMDLELNKLLRDIDNIRYEYDNIKLSPEFREKMSKLEVKVLIAERDKEIEKKLKENSQLYQLYRLINLNSNVIPPAILLRFNRTSRTDAVNLWKKINGDPDRKLNREEKFEIKRVEDKLKRSLRRAYLNKMFAVESIKYVEDPSKYVAPDFV